MGFLIPGSLVRVQPGVLSIFEIPAPQKGPLLGALLGAQRRNARRGQISTAPRGCQKQWGVFRPRARRERPGFVLRRVPAMPTALPVGSRLLPPARLDHYEDASLVGVPTPGPGVAPPLSARFGYASPSRQGRSLGRSTLVIDTGSIHGGRSPGGVHRCHQTARDDGDACEDRLGPGAVFRQVLPRPHVSFVNSS